MTIFLRERVRTCWYFALVFQAGDIHMTNQVFNQLGKLGTLTFGFYTGHTGAHRERQSGGTDLVLAELGTSECPLV